MGYDANAPLAVLHVTLRVTVRSHGQPRRPLDGRHCTPQRIVGARARPAVFAAPHSFCDRRDCSAFVGGLLDNHHHQVINALSEVRAHRKHLKRQ